VEGRDAAQVDKLARQLQAVVAKELG
jgi:hypothetical protein